MSTALAPPDAPGFGETLTVESINAVGDVVLIDSVDGRRFACTLSSDMPNDSFNCISDVHVGSQCMFSQEGFFGYCTGRSLDGFGFWGEASSSRSQAARTARLHPVDVRF